MFDLYDLLSMKIWTKHVSRLLRCSFLIVFDSDPNVSKM